MMSLRGVRRHGFDWVAERLRLVPLRGSDLCVYQDCQFSLEMTDAKNVAPCQHYVLSSILHRLEQLEAALRCERLSIHEVSGCIEYFTGGTLYQMIPPIVETDVESGERIICDGVHRLYLARRWGRECSVLVRTSS